MILDSIIKSLNTRNNSFQDSLNGFVIKDLYGRYQNLKASGDPFGLKNFLNNLPSDKLEGFFAELDKGHKDINEFSEYIQSSASEMSFFGAMASGAGSSIRSALSGIASSFVNFGIMTLANLAVSGVVSFIDDQIHKSERLIEKGKQAKSTINDLKREFSSKVDNAHSLASQYDTLARGVDTLNGKNISLNDDDYRQFLSVNQQLLELFPSLDRVYDSNGNAMVRLNGDASTLSDSLNNILELQGRENSKAIVEKLPDAFNGTLEEVNKSNHKLEELRHQRALIMSQLNHDPLNIADSFSNNSSFGFSGSSWDDASSLANTFIQLLDTSGITYEQPKFQEVSSLDNTSVSWFAQVDVNAEEQNKNRQLFQEVYSKFSSDAYIDTMRDYVNNTLDMLAVLEQDKESWGELDASLYTWLQQESDDFNYMTNQDKNAVNNIIANTNWDKVDGVSDFSDAKLYIQDNIIPLFKETVLSDSGVSMQSMLLDFLQVDPSSLSSKAYMDIYDNMIADIQKQFGEEEANKISVIFEPTIANVRETDSLIQSMRDSISATFSKDTSFNNNILNTFSDEEIQLIYKITAQDNFSDTFSNVLNQFDAITQQSTIKISAKFDDAESGFNSFMSSFSSISDILSSQSAGTGISMDIYNTEGLNDYRSALENVNGVIQLNKDKVEELSKAKAKETLTTLEANDAQAKNQYIRNMEEIEQLRNSDLELTEAQKTRLEFLESQQSLISSNSQQYQIMADTIRQATGAYQEWLDNQNGPEAGDMGTDVENAITAIRDVADENSDSYGRIGTNKYKAAMEFIVPDTIPEEEVQSYVENLQTYFKDKAGAEKFIEEALDKGLMEYSPDNGTLQIAAGKTMEDYAAAFNWKPETIQAMFGIQKDFGIDLQFENYNTGSINDEIISTQENIDIIQARIDELNEKPYHTKVESEELHQLLEDLQMAYELQNNLGSQKVSEYVGLEQEIGSRTSILNAYKQDGIISEDEIAQAEAQIANLIAQKEQLGVPTQIQIETYIGELDSQIEIYQQELSTLEQKKMHLGVAIEPGTEERISELKQLISNAEADKETAKLSCTVELNSNTYTEKKNTIENDSFTPKRITVSAEVWDARQQLYNIRRELDAIKSKTVYITTVNSTLNLPSIGNTTSGNDSKPSISGIHTVNGTAHVNGTLWASAYTGLAYATGNWASRRSGTTLIGELGREIVVNPNTGKWRTYGDNGAEFINLPFGAIVFNHKQTEALLERGFVAGRGAAMANGTALIPKNTQTNSGNAFVSGNALADGNSDSSKKADTTIDWIERLTKSLERMFDALKSYAEDLYQTYQNQNAAIDTALAKGNKDVKTFRDASVYYTKKASAVGIDNSLQKKIREGQLYIEDIEDEDLREKIKEFQDLYEKAQDCSDKARDLQLELIELNKSKLDNIEDDFDNLISYQEKLISNQKSFIDLQEAKGGSASVSDYDGMIDAQNQIISYLNGKRQELQNQFDSLTSSGVLVENTDDWWEWKGNIESIQKELNSARSDIEDLNDSIRDIRWQGFNDGIDKLDDLNDELDFLSDKIEDSALFSEDGKLTSTGSTKIALLSMQMVNARTKVADYDMAIKALDRELANGVISQSQYNEELGKYKEQQRKASNELSKYKKAVIDVVKEGIDKQTDAMEKYIKAQKEAISQEERYEDYLERVNETQKQINSIRAQLASMSGDDSGSAKAKRQSLNDELLKLEDKLAKDQKDHKTDMLKEAYDEELDALKEKADKEKELLDTDLAAQSEAIAGMLAGAQDNYAAVYEELGSMAEAYGIHLSSELSDPWKNAVTAIETYKKAAAAASQTAAGQSAVGSNVADINTNAQKQATNNSASVPPAKETAAAKADGQWKKNNTGWWYEHDGGSYTKNGWEQIDGKWYHFDGKGYMQKGWVKDGQTWYYLNPGGDMAVNKWIKAANGKDWYYLGSDGRMVENGMINSNGKDYYLAAGGKMKTGWFKLGATWYYANASGAVQKNQWIKGANGKDWYYVGPDGIMYANMNAVIDGKNSRFDGNGRWLGYFARGARDISSLTGYGVIGEGGRDELVATKGGQLVRLDDAKMIFSNEQTKRLWELSQLSAPLSLSAVASSLPATALPSQKAVSISQNFGSLITVEGNVTKDALPGLEKIMDQKLKSFEKNMYKGLQSLTGLKR
ncbi:hypothetical protein [Murimonas intestini]|uniref:hypothetical protein n=2 Tax=Murimonas intestini TaxID=1337051 RepID=UPI0011DE35F8|nr:hypothetical protein [Murimonas intestini]